MNRLGSLQKAPDQLDDHYDKYDKTIRVVVDLASGIVIPEEDYPKPCCCCRCWCACCHRRCCRCCCNLRSFCKFLLYSIVILVSLTIIAYLSRGLISRIARRCEPGVLLVAADELANRFSFSHGRVDFYKHSIDSNRWLCTFSFPARACEPPPSNLQNLVLVSYDLRQVMISSYIIESTDTLVVMVLHPSCVDNPFSHYWKYAYNNGRGVDVLTNMTYAAWADDGTPLRLLETYNDPHNHVLMLFYDSSPIRPNEASGFHFKETYYGSSFGLIPISKENPDIPVSILPKMGIVACTSPLSSKGRFLVEWLEYHRLLGVEHFYIYVDRLQTDNTTIAVADAYKSIGLATVITWSHRKGSGSYQPHAQNHCLHRFGHLADWIMFIDIDEFVFSKQLPVNSTDKGMPLKQILESIAGPKAAAVEMKPLEFGASDTFQESNLTHLVLEHFVKCENKTNMKATDRKLFVRPAASQIVSVHVVLAIKTGWEQTAIAPFETLRYNHYKSAHRNRTAPHQEADRDREILKFIPPLKAAMTVGPNVPPASNVFRIGKRTGDEEY